MKTTKYRAKVTAFFLIAIFISFAALLFIYLHKQEAKTYSGAKLVLIGEMDEINGDLQC